MLLFSDIVASGLSNESVAIQQEVAASPLSYTCAGTKNPGFVRIGFPVPIPVAVLKEFVA